MAGTNLGTAYVQIMPSTKGIAGSISNVLSGESTSAGKSAGLNIVGALKGVIAAAGIGAFFKKALDFGGELQQNLGGTEAVFGQYAQNVQSMAEDAYKNMGMSASDYMATANKMGSLFQGSGLTQQRSLELTTKAMQRAADVASVMGISQESAMESIAGAAKGNFAMMDNLGVAMNATTLAAYALEKGVNFDWNTASNAEKAELAMQMFMERTAQYEGNFAEESEKTFSGSIESMKAAATNLMANLSLGRDIQEPLRSLMETTKNFLVNNLFPMIGNILKQLPGLLGEALLWAFENIPNMVDSVISFINNLTTSLQNNGGKIKETLVTIGKAALEMFKNIDWKGLGLAVINLLWTAIQGAGSLIWDALKAIGTKASEWFHDVDWEQLGKDVLNLLLDGINAIGNLIWEGLKDIGSKAHDWFKDIEWLQLGKDVINFILDGFAEIGSWIWEKLQGLGNDAVEKFKEIDWLQLGKDVINSIVGGLTDIGHTIWETIKGFGDSGKSEFDGIDWYNTGYNAGNEIANGMYGSANGVQNAANYIASTLQNAINGQISGIGVNVVQGITVGMSSPQTQRPVARASASVAGKVTKSLQKSFSVGSPSKLMRDEVGQWIPAGIAEGIEANAGMVTDAMKNIASDTVGAFDTDFAYNGTVSALEGSTPANTDTITMNIYPSAGMNERQLADMVQQRLALAQRQKQAAWGTA